MNIDPRFSQGEGLALFAGSELLVKGALEVRDGVSLFTGYPASPVSGVFDALRTLAPILEEHGQVARIANNESLAVAMLGGAQMAGCRAVAAFSAAGFQAAADAVAHCVAAGIEPGAGGVIITGDDPWGDATLIQADSRFLAEQANLPIIEPATLQELKDWVDLAFQLGEAGDVCIGYLVTTALLHGGGTVECRPNHFPKVSEHHKATLLYDRDIEPHLARRMPGPMRAGQREQSIAHRLERVKAAARQLGVNRTLYRPQKDEVVPLGIVAAGGAYASLAQAFDEMGLTRHIPVLKLGMTFPVDEAAVVEFAQRCQQIIVIEERRSFVERRIVEILNPLRQAGERVALVYGKQFPNGLPGMPAARGLNASIIIDRLTPIIRDHPTLPIELTNGRLSAELARLRDTASYEVRIPQRTPTFCSGCPHRDSSSVLLELRKDLRNPQYMLERHKRKPVDLVCHGDTGCNSLLMFEPNRPLMHNYSGMGLGGGTGGGVDPFIENKQLVFMGDGTFFHSGQAAISQSIHTGQDITYIILDNKTAAMTGHHAHAGEDVDLMGRASVAQDIERTIAGMMPKKLARDVRVVRIDPSDRSRYRRLIEQTLLAEGVKIVVADKECGITFHRRARQARRMEAAEHGYLPRESRINVATAVCEGCLECTQQTGCPSLTFVQTEHGRKVQTDLSTCVNDGACHRIEACPAFEDVTVLRRQPPRARDAGVDLSDLPDPAPPVHADRDIWRCYVAGVGGQGIGLMTSILASAGHAMGYRVQFQDRRGIAVRTGMVCSQILFTRRRATNGDHGAGLTTALIPYGKADLLLGVDLIEAARGLDPSQPWRVASPRHTSAVVNTAAAPTTSMLMGQDACDRDDLDRALRQYTRSDHYVGLNISELCQRLLGSTQFVNQIMLGLAFQKGYVPIRLDALEQAIRKLAPSEIDRNLKAFRIGRLIAARPGAVATDLSVPAQTAGMTLRRKVADLRANRGDGARAKRAGRAFRQLIHRARRAMRGLHDDALMRDVIIRAYDCAVWGGEGYAAKYLDLLVRVFKVDREEHGYAATRAAVDSLARVMVIKDEVYVAALLTSVEKYRQDAARFNVDVRRGDRVRYRHFTRPEFDVFGLRLRFDWISRDWQLRVLRRLKLLRSVLPGWHKREVRFRDWYVRLIERFVSESPVDPRECRRWAAVLGCPQTVSGFRAVRATKMDAARRHAEGLLALEADAFDRAKAAELAPVAPQADAQRKVSLPVMGVGA